MNCLSILITGIAIWLAIDALIILIFYIGFNFVKPRWPEWWERNIAAFPPSEDPPFY